MNRSGRMLPSLGTLSISAPKRSSKDSQDPYKRQKAPPTPLIVAIEGLPGCGKNYICTQLYDKLQQTLDVDDAETKVCKLVYKDLDDFSQKHLESEDGFQKKLRNIRIEIDNFIMKSTLIDDRYRHVLILLCGVSFVSSPSGKRVSMLPTHLNTLRLWLDIVPKDSLGVAQDSKGLVEQFRGMRKGLPQNVFVELIESARRSTLREFKPHELENDWRGNPDHDFAELAIPEEALSDEEFKRQFHRPLTEFAKDGYYGKYLTVMLQNMIEEDYGSNRSNAEYHGFRPISINQTGQDPVSAVYRILCAELLNSCFDHGADCLNVR